MTPRTPTEKRLFLAELRAGRQNALRELRRAMRAEGGQATKAAKRLGIGVQTLYRARSESPAVRQVLDRYGIGQAGAAAYARNRINRAGSKEKSEIDV